MTHACQTLLPCLLFSLSIGPMQAQTPPAAAAHGVITLDVDASHISRKIVSAREHIPAAPGPLTLVYPKWIPGDHGPTGPITDLVNVHFIANGQPLPWQRDGVDMYAFHVTVPEGVTEIEADFASVGEFAAGADFNLGNTSTAVQGDLNWDQIVLYPNGAPSDAVKVKAAVTLPPGWSYATALPEAIQEGGQLRFGAVSLTTLVDSPVMMGSVAKQFDVTPPGETRKHTLSVFGETPGDLALPEERIAGFRNLVAETGALFGARHYRDYHFLVEAHGDANNGLEHHQSSDNQVPELGMVTPSFNAESGYLLAHEMTHSWNGKYRRPVGLATANYQQPMVGDLLWVYEGLTSYFGEVLAVRAGLDTPADFRDRLAGDEAVLAYCTGRDWRPLQDTATAAQLLYLASPHWEALRRSTDYYIEGPLLWLEVDSILRQQSHGRKSIDDFARAFYGPPSLAAGAEPVVLPYTFDDVVKALNSVAPYDLGGAAAQARGCAASRATCAGTRCRGLARGLYRCAESGGQRCRSKYGCGRFALIHRTAARSERRGHRRAAGLGRRQSRTGAGVEDCRGQPARLHRGWAEERHCRSQDEPAADRIDGSARQLLFRYFRELHGRPPLSAP